MAARSPPIVSRQCPCSPCCPGLPRASAGHIGALSGFSHLITCDMGGTSTDVCLLRAGNYEMTTEGRVGAFPVKMRQIDINSIGLGGGSIASLGTGGFLSVGPRSAGAMPGPADRKSVV